MEEYRQYIALLRGINVGGHHKVAMKQLAIEFDKLGYKDISTILNSGNIIFKGPQRSVQTLEVEISSHLAAVFGFSIPVIVRSSDSLKVLIDRSPFEMVEVNKDIRLYVTFITDIPKRDVTVPFINNDKSFTIIDIHDKMVSSVLDLSISTSPNAMKELDTFFSKNITTRNWNTVTKIGKKLN